jgi:hypothetical protein
LFSSPDIKKIASRRMRLVEHVACMGQMRNILKILVGKRQRKIYV